MACDSAGIDSSYQFSKTGRLIEHAKGGKRTVDDYFLTRYACYLIAMNGDASKPQIAVAQTYFAIQTRRQELSDQQAAQEARLEIRERVRSANKALNSAAKDAGVTRYPFFHDAGYKGLYGGIGNNDIKKCKGIPKNENLLDRSGRAELAANEFRITQTEEKLRHENVLGQVHAEKTHRTVGDHIRETIKKLGGTPGVVARIGSGAAWPFGGLAYSLTIARDSGLPNSAIRFNTLHPIIASLFCDS